MGRLRDSVEDPEATFNGAFLLGETDPAQAKRQVLSYAELLTRVSPLMQSCEGCEPDTLAWFPCKGFPCRAALTAKLRCKRQTAAAWLPRIKSPPSHRLLLLPGVVAQVP